MKLLTSTFLLVIFIGCGNNKANLTPSPSSRTMNKAPEWFLNTPEQDGFVYTTATAVSQDMQLAINKAQLDAANQLANQLDSWMEANAKSVREEVNPSEQLLSRYNQTQKQVTGTFLKNYKIKKKDLQPDEGVYRAYVLLEYDEGAQNRKILEQMKNDKEVYDAFKETQMLKELESDVEKYLERKGLK